MLGKKKDGLQSSAVRRMLGHAKGSAPPPEDVAALLHSFRTGVFDKELAAAAGISELGDKFAGSVATRITYLTAAITAWMGTSKGEPLDLLMPWPWFLERIAPLRAVVEAPTPAEPSAGGSPPAVVAAVGAEVTCTRTNKTPQTSKFGVITHCVITPKSPHI